MDLPNQALRAPGLGRPPKAPPAHLPTPPAFTRPPTPPTSTQPRHRRLLPHPLSPAVLGSPIPERSAIRPHMQMPLARKSRRLGGKHGLKGVPAFLRHTAGSTVAHGMNQLKAGHTLR